jgi:CRP/FNR family transcriptional regulator
MRTPPPAEWTARLLRLYPALQGVPEAERHQVLAHEAQVLQVPAACRLFDEGAPCGGFPMVLSGCVRVARGSPDGRRLELYRVTPGELCVVSTSCLFGQATLSAHGQTTEASELVLLSPAGFEQWCRHDAFRRYVFGIFADRLTDMMALVEAVAFQRLDQRLSRALLARSHPVCATHQELADELGTVREIVSRLLSRFERAGWVRLARERIEIVDAGALAQAAQGLPGA